jgi:hypothetical protein
VDKLVDAIKANSKLVANLTNTRQEQQVATSKSNPVF